ncbi:hypothetical protein RRG08_014633 [Elysia crispata]|uniref:Uncharacterized protein n=1 Tax=Elysia crispata TaxID=231223 RepID=A0AAE1D3X8_9GAST|nr:hypothetical protein RRG08_014633 [Elysia crispata]
MKSPEIPDSGDNSGLVVLLRVHNKCSRVNDMAMEGHGSNVSLDHPQAKLADQRRELSPGSCGDPRPVDTPLSLARARPQGKTGDAGGAGKEGLRGLGSHKANLGV